MNNNKQVDEYKVGADIGGTFTDIVFIGSNGAKFSKKVLSTPDDYSQGVVQGIKEVLTEEHIDGSAIKEIVHASTIVTNTCIELKGAKTGLITTKGFRDVLEIGRGRIPVLYDLAWNKPVPLVPRDLRLEVDERIGKHGEVLRPLNLYDVELAINALVAVGVEAVAISLYNSPLNPKHEKKIEELLKQKAPHLFISRSTKIRPMLKEYERTSEAVVNAYVMPIVSKYLISLRNNLDAIGVKAPLYVMQSSSGMITATEAAEKPIEIVEGGPAAGVVGAAELALKQNINNLITLDLGGTTTKVSIVENGKYTRSDEYEVGAGIHRASRLHKGMGYVLRIPSIDIAEIGAGGGSIVWLDKGGMMKVGPRSTGASPGPACYGLGGLKPTLTDSYVALGYMNSRYLLGGDFALDAEKAFKAFETKVAKPLGISVIEAAYGAYRIANSNIKRAMTSVSSERGRDPRLFSLVVYGGAGAMHAVEVARELGIKRVIIPPYGGIFSAFGLLCADIERNYIRSFGQILETSIMDKINDILADITDDVLGSAVEYGHDTSQVHIDRYVDLRYKKQASELSILLPDGKITAKDFSSLYNDFNEEHKKIFGHCFTEMPLELVNFRVTSRVITDKPILGNIKETTRAFSANHDITRKAYFGEQYGLVNVAVLDVGQIDEKVKSGPLLVDTYDTTIVIPPDCTLQSLPGGTLLINIISQN